MRREHEAGAAVVEFALVLPILLLFVFGIIEFGSALYRKEVLTSASREGARYGIIMANPRPTATQITNVVNTSLTNAGFDATKATVTVTGAQGTSGSNLTVGLDYPFSFSVLPKLIMGFSQAVTLSAKTVMQLE